MVYIFYVTIFFFLSCINSLKCLEISKKKRWNFLENSRTLSEGVILDERIQIKNNPELKNLFDNGEFINKSSSLFLRKTSKNTVIKRACNQKYIDLDYFIEHPGVCPIYSFYKVKKENEGQSIKMEVYYEMTYLKRYSPDDFQNLSVKDSKLILLKVFLTYMFLLDNGIIHNDIKADNMMMSMGKMIFIDFDFLQDLKLNYLLNKKPIKKKTPIWSKLTIDCQRFAQLFKNPFLFYGHREIKEEWSKIINRFQEINKNYRKKWTDSFNKWKSENPKSREVLTWEQIHFYFREQIENNLLLVCTNKFFDDVREDASVEEFAIRLKNNQMCNAPALLRGN